MIKKCLKNILKYESLIKKDFNSEPVYNDKYINIKTKIKILNST